ncbi:MAG: hypothetical protein ACYDCO_16640 [Armatimonadota bacterium]
MSFPGFDQLFELHDPLANRAFRGGWESDEDACALLRAEDVPTTPPVIPWYMGGATPSDIIWTGMGYPLIVSQRVADLLTANGLIGWETYDVIITGKDGSRIPGYHGIAIHGRCGRTDLSRCQIVLKEYPGGWYPSFKGCYFDPDSWDGSDFFMETPDAKGNASATKFITARVWKAFRKAKIANLQYERLDEVEVDTATFEISSAYRLPEDFKQRLMRAYQEAGVPIPDRYAEIRKNPKWWKLW